MERDGKGRFLKGHKSNGGRPKGLAELVRSRTRDGAELVEFFLKVFKGEEGEEFKHRIEAAEWLADRGFGKAIQAHEVTGEDGGPLVITYVNDWRNIEN